MLEIVDYSKKYGQKEVLKNINLKMEDSKVYGLIGNNGVGKTTLLQSISNFKIGYTGEIKFNNQTVLENQSVVEDIVYISEDMFGEAFYTEYKIKKLFKILSTLYKNWDQEFNTYLVEKFNINLKSKYKKLSKGEKNLVNLVIGLTTRGKITIFDEPTSGLDAKTRYAFYQVLMEDLELNPRIVIISTHIIDEAANYFEDVIFLADKSVKIFDSVENINKNAKSFMGSPEKLVILKDKNIIDVEKFGGMEKYYIYDNFTKEELEKIEESNITIENITLQNLIVHTN
ncbi:ATP-binding cassette domain-containing protein [Miniphocaeibacter halophilus]|uniref:ABC transporter ATP-binding protein n=1 Tax=Miniphocaeibacter halophilus TaxID=2931922 RepID=A0AC61MUE3_9FIRM|nr:ATP-binding cassette domain-containing protein [Miniphocaeibacter halophilus]QQK08235.1 ABC transporter ATP-binding protein [Miniphocaeibacter halophilus]